MCFDPPSDSAAVSEVDGGTVDAAGNSLPPSCEMCGQWMFRKEVQQRYVQKLSRELNTESVAPPSVAVQERETGYCPKGGPEMYVFYELIEGLAPIPWEVYKVEDVERFRPVSGEGSEVPALDVVEWLQERADNCRRIAGLKSVTEVEGWLDDASYFDSAISLLCRGAS